MRGLQIADIKKLTEQRRKMYLSSSLNVTNIDNQLGILIPILTQVSDKIKENESHSYQIKNISQIFDSIADVEIKKKAIEALEYLLFCFDSGCKTIKKMIRRELYPLIKDIKHLIDFELKKIIKTSIFSF